MAGEYRKRISERKRPRLTGRGKDYSFLRLPHFLLKSLEFSLLSPQAVKLLLDVAKMFNGRNNGDLSMPWSRLKCEGWASEGTIHRAKNELLDAGFLLCTRHGGSNRCSLYAITWEPINDCPGKSLEVAEERVASHSWRKQHSHAGVNCSDGGSDQGG